MRWRAWATILWTVVVACGGDGSAQVGSGDDGALVIMTRNLYLGAPLEPLLQQVSDPSQLPAAVGATWRTIQASDVPGRMERVVDEIVTARADVVALQEVALFQTRPALATTAPTTAYDFLDLLLTGLRARGYDYVAAGSSTNFDGEVPDDTGQRIRLVDRDAVLVRAGVRVSDVMAGQYVTRAGFSVGTISAFIPRGWLSMTVGTEVLAFRLVTTHLEIGTFASVQEAQARELVQLLPGSGLVIVAGDLNSAADGDTTASYGIVRAAGLEDPWATLRPGDPGLTCCFAPDLRDPAVVLTERIDLVLHRGALTPSAVDIVGATASSRTAAGVLPSDHAGVVTTYAAAR